MNSLNCTGDEENEKLFLWNAVSVRAGVSVVVGFHKPCWPYALLSLRGLE